MGAASLAPGITFKAQTTLDVREYTNGLPAEMEAHPNPPTRIATPTRTRSRSRTLALPLTLPLALTLALTLTQADYLAEPPSSDSEVT